MPFINDAAYDAALAWVRTNGTRLDICSAEPSTYAAATSTNTLGNASVSIGAPTNGDIDGRKVVVPAISGASVTGTGTATHWAITNGSDTLVATGALSASQAVTSGNTFSLDAFDIGVRDAT